MKFRTKHGFVQRTDPQVQLARRFPVIQDYKTSVRLLRGAQRFYKIIPLVTHTGWCYLDYIQGKRKDAEQND